MQDLNDLYYYVQVADHGGFAQAGRALGMPKSRLSRRIALLEERLGVRLIHRSTRQFDITEIGRSYYEHCKAMLVEAEAAQEAIELTRAGPRGTVRIACPVALLQAHVGAMLAEFMAMHAHVTLHLAATNRRVDPVGEAIDVAIRVRRPPLQGHRPGDARAGRAWPVPRSEPGAARAAGDASIAGRAGRLAQPRPWHATAGPRLEIVRS